MYRLAAAAVAIVLLTGMSINDEPPTEEEVDYIWYQMPFELKCVNKTIYLNQVTYEVLMKRDGKEIGVDITLYTPYSKAMFHAAVDQAANAVLVQGNQWRSP